MPMRNEIVLCATGKAGLDVAQYLAHRSEDRIASLYLSKNCPFSSQIREAAKVPNEKVIWASQLREPEHIRTFANLSFDYLITVYWPNLITPAVFGRARRGTVNFHPALLPINQGWYPHVHSLIDGSPAGVTLHAIDSGVDTGPVWAQETVEVLPTDTAKTLYDRLVLTIVRLFLETWPKITQGELTPEPQDLHRAVYHGKQDAVFLDSIDPNAVFRAKDLIDRLRARSFGNKGFAYIVEGGKRIYLNLRLGDSLNF